jgi:hypothetical protein
MAGDAALPREKPFPVVTEGTVKDGEFGYYAYFNVRLYTMVPANPEQQAFLIA